MTKACRRKSSFSRKLYPALLFFVVFAGALQPHAARAQTVVWDPLQTADMIAQWAKEAAQWITQNLINSAGNATHVASMAVLANSNTINAQAQIDAAKRKGYEDTDVQIAKERVFGTNTGCALASQVAATQDDLNVDNAEKSMEQALMSFASTMAPDNGPLSAIALASNLCKAGVLNTNGTGTLYQGMNCPQTATTPADIALVENPASVTGPRHYTWPTCMTINQNGVPTINSGGCQPQDRPALAAIMHCALMQQPTKANPYINAPANAENVATGVYASQQRTMAGSAVSRCWQAVAKRLIPPQNGSSAGMQAVTQAYTGKCSTMNLTENPTITTTDYTTCTSTGASYMDLRLWEACKSKVPQHAAALGQNLYYPTVTASTTLTQERGECNDFLRTQEAENQQLNTVIMQTPSQPTATR